MKTDISIRETSNSFDKWLIIDKIGELSKHSLSMMEGVDSFLPINYKASENAIYINVSEYCSLKDFLAEAAKPLILTKLLTQAVESRIKAVKYLLPTESIFYSPEHSYVNTSDMSLHMIFLPLDGISDTEDFENWMLYVLGKFPRDENIDEINGIKNALEKADYYINNLLKKLNKLSQKYEGRTGINFEKNNSERTHSGNENFQAVYVPQRRSIRVDSPKYRLTENQEGYKYGCVPSTHPDNHLCTGKDVQKKKSEAIYHSSDTSEQKRRKYVKIICSQVLIISAFFLSAFIMYGRVEKPLKMLLAMLILFGISDYLIVSKFILKNKVDKKENEAKDKNIKKGGNKDSERNKNKHVKFPNFKKKIEKTDQIHDNSPGIKYRSPISDRTISLEELLDRSYYLVSETGKDSITINRSEFAIGRNSELVDYAIEDMSISRIHAFIKKIDNKLFVLDNGSRNGTFINGVRLDKDEMSEMITGDVLSFAKYNYKLHAKI